MRNRATLLGSLGLWLLTGALPAHAETPFSTKLHAFGQAASVQLLGVAPERARAAVAAAQAEVAELEALLDTAGTVEGGLGRLNAAAGGAPVPLHPIVLNLLSRTAGFCTWSDGITSVLGGHLYEMWGRSHPVAALPTPEMIEAALPSAACDHLAPDVERGNASLAAGSRVDPWGFELGAVVDRAVEVLKQEGASNGFVSIGMVARAFGPGPGGRGWEVDPPIYTGMVEPLPEIWLKDQSLAAASPEDGVLGAGGERFAPYLDLRKGRPGEGVIAVLAVSELATEAQGLATTMFVTGSRAGQLRLGNLEPRPAVLWVLGSGEGRPLLVEYHWGELTRPGARAPIQKPSAQTP